MARPRHGSGRRSWEGLAAGRTVREWAVRGTLAVAALLIGYFSVVATLANVAVKVDPKSAYALNSADGLIAGAYALQMFTSTPEAASDSETARLSIEALRSDAAAVDALTVLGLQAQLRSEDELADKIFGYSVWLSRRELQPQIWAIEGAVLQGDIDLALKNYDIALRTSPKARDILFPVLSSAVSQPKVRASLLPILAPNPIWALPFVQYAASKSTEPQGVVGLFKEASAKGFPIDVEDKSRLVNNLVSRNFTEEAWNYYSTFRHGAERGQSRDPSFEFDADVRTYFDWNVGITPGLSAAILREKDRGVLDFAAAPSTGATAVTQLQMLPPGNYRLVGRSRGIEQPERSRPYWTLACRFGQEFGRVYVPNSSEGGGNFSGEFAVPADCPVQSLSLILRGSDSISGVTGQIESAHLVAVRR